MEARSTESYLLIDFQKKEPTWVLWLVDDRWDWISDMVGAIGAIVSAARKWKSTVKA